MQQHFRGLRATSGISISYRAEGSDAIEIEAVLGTSEREEFGQGIDEVDSSTTDFLILAAELTVDGLVFLPQRGDLIVCELGTFEVVQRSERTVYRWSDSTRTILRVYTQEIEAVQE